MIAVELVCVKGVRLGALPALIKGMSKIPMLIVLAGYAAFVPGVAYYFDDGWTAGWPVMRGAETLGHVIGHLAPLK